MDNTEERIGEFQNQAQRRRATATWQQLVVVALSFAAAVTLIPSCTKPRPKPDAATQATDQKSEQRIRELTVQLANAERRADELAAKLARAEDRDKGAKQHMADAVEKATKPDSKPNNEDLPVGERMVRVWDGNSLMWRTVRIDSIEWGCAKDKAGNAMNFAGWGLKEGHELNVRDETTEAWIREYLGLKPL